MNKEIARLRFNDVLTVDSINSTQADFLATHVPFRKITVTDDLTGAKTVEHISEEQIFNKYFADSTIYNSHQLLVVDGSSGSGKSHFIRWISAKLEAQENQNDIILMIKRSDNTLKGTIKQFLEIEEVKNIRNKDIYERLVKANQNVSEQRFKNEIYYKFLAEIGEDADSDIEDVVSIFNSSTWKILREFMASMEFQEKMLMTGGAIERIYSKIVDDSEQGNKDTLALFVTEDFTIDDEFFEKIKNNASKKSKKMAKKLLPELDGTFEDDECNPNVLTKYMNSKVEAVIKSCAGIEPGDFQEIFKEIRQELYRKNKNLILLIEDITSCTGINKDLLNALIVKHTGEYEKDNMCRIISIIGTTTEYFKEFRDNYLERITTKITIDDGAIGNNSDDLVQFVAKYLNTMSITSEGIISWYNNGGLESEYPVHDDDKKNKWDTYNYSGKKLSLYPFTKRAIVNLYNGLEYHRTPRYVIRSIIEPAIDNILKPNRRFPDYLEVKPAILNFDVESRIKSTLVNMKINNREEYKKQVFAIIAYWGDGTLDVSDKSIGCVNTYIFKDFQLNGFAEKIIGSTIENDIFIDAHSESESEPKLDIPVINDNQESKVVETNKQFDDFTRILSDWHYEGKHFMRAYKVRDEISRFIYTSVEWQREDVSLQEKKMVEDSSTDLIELERQDRSKNNGLVLLENSDETYQLLLAFGKWLYLGKSSWNFTNSASSIRVATNWLEKNKHKFISVVRGAQKKNSCPKYMEYAIISEIYRGVLNGDYKINRISDLKPENLLIGSTESEILDMKGHSQEWIDLHENIIYLNHAGDKNKEFIHKGYNLIQGNAPNSRKIILKYTAFENDFKELKKNNFYVNIDELEESAIKARNTSKDYLKKILSRIDKVVEAEIKESKINYLKILEFLGFSDGTLIENEDIKELLNESIQFYNDAELNGINILSRVNDLEKMKGKCSNIIKALNTMNTDCRSKLSLETLILYSQNPSRIVIELIELFKNVDVDRVRVYKQMQNEKNELTRSGNWSEDSDPRFESEKNAFYDLCQRMEE